jgi:hypothetical protein
VKTGLIAFIGPIKLKTATVTGALLEKKGKCAASNQIISAT